MVLKPRNLEVLGNSVDNARQVDDRQTEQEAERTLEELWTEGLQVDPFPMKILGLLRDKVSHSKEISLAEREEINGRLHYRGKMYVPDSHALEMKLCRIMHDSPVAGHPGRAKTFNLMQRQYYRPRFYQFIVKYSTRSKVSDSPTINFLPPHCFELSTIKLLF